MGDKSPDIPPEFLAHMQRRAAISQLTEDEAIREFWARWNERTPGRIDFLLRGYVDWRSELKQEFDVGLGWLRPSVTDPVDAETSFQMNFPPKEYGAGVKVEDVSDEATALAVLRTAAAKAALMTDVLSFLTGFSLTWRPARILNVVDSPDSQLHDGVERKYRKYFAMPFQEEMTSIVLDDGMIQGPYSAVLNMVWGLAPDLRQVVTTAISWQAQANRVPGFSRYVHYWASVELLASYFWERLPAAKTQKTPESETRQQILQYLIDVSSKNYLEIVRKCADILQPSARIQVKALARIIDFDSDLFFSRASKEKKSIYEIRNDIAHGNIANDDRLYADTHRAELQKYSNLTRDFVVRVAIAAGHGKLAS